MTLKKTDLITEVKYFGAKMDEGFKLVGYVDVKHGGDIVFHADLTQRGLRDEDVSGKTAEEIQSIAAAEADEILAKPETQQLLDDYITLKNLGLY